MTATAQQRELYLPSPLFYALVALTIIFGTALALDYRYGGVTMFLFVVVGWILSLTLHEFGHAIVAFVGGTAPSSTRGI